MEKLVKFLLDKYDPIFAGSFGLKLFGLLNREIGDIDICIDHNTPTDCAETGSGDATIEGIPVTCSSVWHFNKKVDLLRSSILPDYKIIIWKGMELKVADPRYAIRAKEQYIKQDYKSSEKHRQDLEIIRFNILCDRYYGEY